MCDADGVSCSAVASSRLARAAAVEAVGGVQRVLEPVGEREQGSCLRVVCRGGERGAQAREGAAHVCDDVGPGGAEPGEKAFTAAAEQALQQWEEEGLTAGLVGSLDALAGRRQRLRHGARARCNRHATLVGVRFKREY